MRPLSGYEGACGLRWCGLRGLAWGATRTKNSDLPSKKNETVFLFCFASRASGSVGLSPPTPCSDEQNLPAHAGAGGRLLGTRREERAALSAAKGLAGMARACVDIVCEGDRICLSHRGVRGERVISESPRSNTLRDGPQGRGCECGSVGRDGALTGVGGGSGGGGSRGEGRRAREGRGVQWGWEGGVQWSERASRPSPSFAPALFTSQSNSTFSSKSKKVNCIQGMLTGCPVSRLTNWNLKVVS